MPVCGCSWVSHRASQWLGLRGLGARLWGSCECGTGTSEIRGSSVWQWSGALGSLRIQGWFLNRLRVLDQLQRDPRYVYVYIPYSRPLSWAAMERSSLRPGRVCVCMNTCFCLCWSVWSAVCMCIFACTAVGIHPHPGWILAHGVAAALTVGCQVQQPLTQEN